MHSNIKVVVALGKFILGLFFRFLGVPNSTFFGLSLYFDNLFARKTVGSRETPRDGLFLCIAEHCLEFLYKLSTIMVNYTIINEKLA